MKFLIFILISHLLSTPAICQVEKQVFNSVDTSNFSPNFGGGWQVMLAYVANRGQDSVRLELIAHHSRNIQLRQNNLLGHLKKPVFLPGIQRKSNVTVGSMQFAITISTDGEVWLEQTSGPEPPGENYIIPIALNYKM